MLTKKPEIQALLRKMAFEKVTQGKIDWSHLDKTDEEMPEGKLRDVMRAGQDAYSIRIPGEEAPNQLKSNRDYWVVLKLTAKDCEDAGSREAFDPWEAEAKWKEELAKREANAKAAAEKKAALIAAQKAKKAARQAEKEKQAAKRAEEAAKQNSD